MTSVLYRSPREIYRTAARAHGMYLYDDGGTPFLDMSGGAAVSLLGHQHPVVVERVRAQLAELAYVHSAFFTTRAQEQLAAKLAGRFPEPGARVWFSSGGSEANETAVKMAWQYWRSIGRPEKQVVISREFGYHGNTFLTLSLSGHELRRDASAAPLIDWPRIAPCYPYRHARPRESMEDYGARTAAELRSAIERTGGDRVAAFICEPIVGSALGVVPPVPGYLSAIRRICDEQEILLIFDEVMCGSGRAGSYFAFEAEGAVPDIVTLGKGMSGGYQPLAATIVNRRVSDVFADKGFAQGFTYIGHATACAAGCAVQDVVDESDVLAQVERKGRRFLEMLVYRLGDHPRVGQIRGRGLFIGIELVTDRATRAGFAEPRSSFLRAAAMEQGLICYPGEFRIEAGYVPHILLAPPVLVEEEHMNACIEILARLFDAL